VAGGDTEMADLRLAGIGVTVPKGHPTQMGGSSFPTLSPGDDVQAFVDARIAEGSDYIKIMYEHAFPTVTKQQIEDVVAAPIAETDSLLFTSVTKATPAMQLKRE